MSFMDLLSTSIKIGGKVKRSKKKKKLIGPTETLFPHFLSLISFILTKQRKMNLKGRGWGWY